MMARFQAQRQHTEECESESCVARVIVAISAALAGLTLLLVLRDWLMH